MNNDEGIKKKYSLEHIINMGFDEEFQVPAVELLGYDPLIKDADGNIVGGLKRITTSAFGDYGTNDIEEIGALTYIGKEDAGGDWYIQKIDTTSGTTIRYATAKNNANTASYSAAWTDRASLSYGTYGTAF